MDEPEGITIGSVAGSSSAGSGSQSVSKPIENDADIGLLLLCHVPSLAE